jgi:alpha-glucoside transport system substrate-binding protein
VLRLDGADVYNGWANGDLPFSSPEVSEAFDRFRSLVLAPGRLDGGTTTAVETGIRRVFDPLFGDEPGCAMAKQADFALGWMPADTTVGPDGEVDFFVLPDVTASDGVPPLVVGGDVAVQFRRDPDVDAFVAFLAGEQAGEPWARQGGFLSPKSSFDPDVYPTSAQRRIAELLTTASTLAFDASDQMPASIGSALLWQDITLWVAGVADYEAMALDLDDAFAALDEASPLSSGTPP